MRRDGGLASWASEGADSCVCLCVCAWGVPVFMVASGVLLFLAFFFAPFSSVFVVWVLCCFWLLCCRGSRRCFGVEKVDVVVR